MLSWTFWHVSFFVITNVNFFFTFVRKSLPMSYLEMVLLLMLMKRTFWTTCKKILKVHYLLLNLFYNMCVFNFFFIEKWSSFSSFYSYKSKTFIYTAFLTCNTFICIHVFLNADIDMLYTGLFSPRGIFALLLLQTVFFSSWIVKKKFIKVRWYAKLQLAHSSIRPLTTRAKKKTGENFTVQKRHN